MALIKCVECNNEISDKASSCPKCGAPAAGSISTQSAEEEVRDVIQCPFCKHSLDAAAVTCGYCGAEYGYYNKNMSVSEVWSDSRLDRAFKVAVRLLIGTASLAAVLIGITMSLRRGGVAALTGIAALFVIPFVLISIKGLLNAYAVKSRGKIGGKVGSHP